VEEAVAANPDWFLITSWNERHEGSEIEPSVENGPRALKTAASFASKFRSLNARTPWRIALQTAGGIFAVKQNQ